MERPFDRLTVLSNVEGHHNFACFEAAPQNHITTATGVLCACPPSVVRFGGGYRLGRLLGVKMKRDPHVPFESAVGALLFELLLGHDTRILPPYSSRVRQGYLFEGEIHLGRPIMKH